MKSSVITFLSGVLFSVGLGISGMTQPAKVIGFLDITGNWDPSLIWVMVGGISVFSLAFHWKIKAREVPFFSQKFFLPTKQGIDRKLLLGAALFGTGWGIAGFCPGPGITNLVTGSLEPLLFVGTMSLGMIFAKKWT